jgi:hypothetical protein
MKLKLAPIVSLALLTHLVTGCKTETLAPDTEERQPLYVSGYIDNDSFAFTNESDEMAAECRTVIVRDSLKKFSFSFADSRSGRTITFSFFSNILRQSPLLDSAIVQGDYELFDRGEPSRLAEITWSEDGITYESSNNFQPGFLTITEAQDRTWDGVRYKLIQLTGFCSLEGGPAGTVRPLTDINGQIVIRDN